ncbi:MAG: N-acetyl sugar amidotransferase [Crocinitomicaceae bacterium]|nr:N-acetyl sugar amidotransferase [Crocinitomicaceae bacterium]
MNTTIPYQICNRCVMDTTDPDIVFDNKGNCNHCGHFLDVLNHHKYKGVESDREFAKTVELIKKRGKGKPYDCVVGLSGGVDSSFTAHLCKEFGLRALLLHVDNGWNTDISVKNIKNMVEKLGFDYVSDVLDWSEFREIQLAFLKSSIVDLEMPTDIALLASAYKVATKYNISTILSGGNYSGEGILPLQWGYHVQSDMKLYRYIVKKFSSVKIKKTPTVGFWGHFFYKFIKGIKTYYPLNSYPYNKDNARSFLIEKYSWECYGGKHHESKITAFWQSYVMPVKYGMDYRRATFSSQICNDQITRIEALKQLKTLPYNEEKIIQDKQFIAKKYGISIEEFEKYLTMPPKTFVDFPNQHLFINTMYSLYFKLRG